MRNYIGAPQANSPILGAAALSGTSISPSSGHRLIIHSITASAAANARIAIMAGTTTLNRTRILANSNATSLLIDYPMDRDAALQLWGDGQVIEMNVLYEEVK